MKALALHLLDIAENSVAAGASQVILGVTLDRTADRLTLEVDDNGRGMDEETLQRTADPFFTSRTTRRVGLGIPLLRQHAEMTGGTVELWSAVKDGTRLKAVFIAGHPDIQPLGDIEGCWWLLASGNPGIDVVLRCSTDTGKFELGSLQVKKELALERLSGSELGVQLRRLIRNNLDEIGLTG